MPFNIKEVPVRMAENRILSFLFLYSLWLPLAVSIAFAAPEGGVVVSGSASIGHPDPLTTQIIQTTDRAIINWNQFNSASNEAISFIQPSISAIALNRVTGLDPSVFLGSLSANGQIFVVNPNGVYFGPNSRVDVGGLFVSTLGISNDDFMSDQYRFSQDSNQPLSAIINQGHLNIKEGNLVMVAPMISNEGTLVVATGGEVALLAATHAIVNTDGEGLIHVLVPLNTASQQEVLLTSQSYSAVLEAVFGQSNVKETDRGITIQNASGVLIHSGSISANGKENLSAGRVVLNSTHATALLPGSLIVADGIGEYSSGGEVLVLSDGKTLLAEGSLIHAVGGNGGEGGFVEASGKDAIWVKGHVVTTSPGGKRGQFLIDPKNLTIINGTGGDHDANLSASSSILFLHSDTATNTVSEVAIETLATSTDIILQANNSITLENLSDGVLTLPDGAYLTLQTSTSTGLFINFEDTTDTIIASGLGTLTINSGGTASIGNLTTAGGAINITTSGNLSIGLINATDSGIVNITASAGTLVDGNGTNTNITAGTATLLGTAIGTSTDAIETTVAILNATSTNGSIFITQSDAIRLESVLASGADSDVTITNTAGDMTIVRITANDQVTLTASAGKLLDGNTTANNISAGTTTLLGTAIGTSSDAIETTISTLNATSTNGSIFITQSDAITLESVLASGADSNVTITNTAGDMTIGSVTAMDQVTLSASTGAILDGNETSTNITAGTATLLGTAIGTST
ncbi:MAG: filamentous hemagglutinin N-terminal domain-containing protein, partial [Nitrospirota bacterium]